MKITEPAEGLSRADIIRLLSNSIKFCNDKVTANRCRPQEGDELRLKYARCVAQLASPLLTALKDQELDALEERISELEELERNKQENNSSRLGGYD